MEVEGKRHRKIERDLEKVKRTQRERAGVRRSMDRGRERKRIEVE